jgi:hypothetical protein
MRPHLDADVGVVGGFGAVPNAPMYSPKNPVQVSARGPTRFVTNLGISTAYILTSALARG